MSVISIDRGTSGAYWKYNAAVISNNDVGRTQRICLILVVHLKKFIMMIDIIMIIDVNELNNRYMIIQYSKWRKMRM